MKKTIKLILVSTMVLLTVITAISCSNASGSSENNDTFVSQEKIIDSHRNEIKSFGTNPTIYESSSRHARFYNGQHLEKPFFGMYNDITFESNLVKYDSINPTVMSYVEKMEENALMHHHYDVDFVKEDTYVEFASYIDMANGEVIMCEVRIFKGDYLDTWNSKRKEGKEPWYAKSVTLSPDFSIDIHARKNIITGQKATYKYPHAIYEGNDEKGHFTDEVYPLSDKQALTINKLGDANKIFEAYRYEGRFCSGQQMPTPFWGLRNNIQLEANLVEYNSFDDKLLNYLKNQEKNAYLNQNYIDENFQEGKIYVEVNSYNDMDNGETIWIELRLVDDSYITEGFKKTWYAKSVTFSPDFTIDVDHNKNISTGKEAYYEYPHAKRN